MAQSGVGQPPLQLTSREGGLSKSSRSRSTTRVELAAPKLTARLGERHLANAAGHVSNFRRFWVAVVSADSPKRCGDLRRVASVHDRKLATHRRSLAAAIRVCHLSASESATCRRRTSDPKQSATGPSAPDIPGGDVKTNRAINSVASRSIRSVGTLPRDTALRPLNRKISAVAGAARAFQPARGPSASSGNG